MATVLPFPLLLQSLLPAPPAAADRPPPPAPAPARTPLRLTADQSQRLLRQLRAHYHEALQGREEATQRRETRYRRYLADQTLREGLQPWDHAPQLFLPLTRQTIERLKDEFVEALGGLEALTIQGMGEEDVPGALLKEQFTRYALAELNPEHWDEVLDAALHDALQDSLGILKVYPYHPPFPRATQEGPLLQTIIRLDVVDEGTMLLPPNAEGLQWPQCAYLGQQLWVPVDEFASMRARGFRLPDPEAVRHAGTDRDYTDDERKLLEFTREGWEPDAASGEFDPRLEMVEMHELFALTEDPTQRQFVVAHWFPHLRTQAGAVAEAGHLARVMRLEDVVPQQVFLRPMWPYFPLTVWQQPRQLRGLNVPDRLEGPQDILNRLAEQMIEQGEVDILPFVFANVALAGDLPNLRRIRPGDVVPLDTMGSVTFSPRQSHNRHFIEQMSVARTWAEEDSGVTAFLQGRSQEQPNAPRTLGGLSLMLQQGQKGFKKQVHHLARQLKAPLKMYLGLWQTQIGEGLRMAVPETEGLEERLFAGGPAGVRRWQRVGQAELSGIFDLRVRVNPEAYLEQQKRLMLAERLDAMLAPIWPLGRRELWKNVWEALGLQEFEQFYPEQVATMQSLLLILQAQVMLSTLEGQVQQVQQAARGGPFAALLGALGGGVGAGGPPGEAPAPEDALGTLLNAPPQGLAMGG